MPYQQAYDEWFDEDIYHAFTTRALPTALSARILVEVFELIIDCLDMSSLTTAGLVCAAWYSRAMHNLYFIVELHDRKGFDLLSQQCRTSPRVRRWLATARQLIASDRPKLPPGKERKDRKNSCFLHALPLALGHVLSGVQVLSITRFHPNATPLPFFLALSHFESVTSLTLLHCRLSNISQLRRLVCAFPRLKHLLLSENILAQESPAGHV
ncbi:uncharacterized protein B0H18DRAFT_83951 [Fomitopsis serialis]|uniref:uncharacterized protein n=1 Tax=Fomitopsis serialis TaxID=139415 RepID=UPI0020083ACB|nr:uncharacterized protein B0H18DRAFT_83951 [Neoantrodia serialis]KAH9931438.1 hypothetical protein B0H18DRAFT_83951 [Neoantrodia serialis]